MNRWTKYGLVIQNLFNWLKKEQDRRNTGNRKDLMILTCCLPDGHLL
jgi:hypothetical protein